MNSEDWENEWTCKCGARWRANVDPWALFEGATMSDSRFLEFGFRDVCPKCGGVVGEHGPDDQVACEVVRYRQIRLSPYRWWDPRTWGQWKLEREVKP